MSLDNEGVARGHFERNYATVLERQKYESKLPVSMKIGTQKRMMIEE